MDFAELLFWLSGLLIVYTYLLYPAILFCASHLIFRKRAGDEHHQPAVTMVIAAFNEERIINEKIRNCLAVVYPAAKLEVLIGSDGSNDRTNEIVRSSPHSNIKLVAFDRRRGKAAVLNDLVQMAAGEVVVFSDANTMYSDDAIAQMMPHFADQQIGGVCGRLVLLNENGKLDAEGERAYWDYENWLKFLEGKVRTVIGANGAVYAIRKSLFDKLPTHKVVMDDFLIPLNIVRQGYDVVYDAEAVVCEYAAPTLQAEFRRKVRIGAANFHGVKEILPLLNPARGFVAFALWSHKIIRWFVPFFLIVLLITNLTLLPQPPYQIPLGLQVVLYVMAAVYWLISKFGRQLSILVFPYYFVVTNFALLVGFFKFLTNSQKPAWARVER